MSRCLYRSTNSVVIGGVCGGLAEYLNQDPILIRLLTVIAFFASAGLPVIIGYIIGWIIIPRADTEFSQAGRTGQAPTAGYRSSSWHTYLPGVILIAIGGFLLLREYIYWFDFDDLWPVLLILIGLGLILLRGTRREPRTLSSTDSRASNGQQANGHSGEGVTS